MADEIRNALNHAKECKEANQKRLSEMNAYIEKKKVEAEQIKLLDS